MTDMIDIVARHVPAAPYEPTGNRTVDDLAWMDDGACLEIGPGVFTAAALLGTIGPRNYQDARAVCDSCTVREQCLEFALAAEDGTGELYEFVGGKTPEQRKRILRDRRAGR